MATSDRTVPLSPPATGTRPRPRRSEPIPWLKPGVFIGGLVPLASILWRASEGRLGAHPIAQAENELGLTALIFLMATLSCTPARILQGWTWQMRIRRELGLFAFFYATVHFLTYLTLDLFFDWGAVVGDVAERPFITVGFLALVLMIPLAVTSTNGAVRRLGFRTWQNIHRMAYVAGLLGVIHFLWRVKIDFGQPMLYAALLAALFGVRIVVWLRKRMAQNPRPR